MDQAEARQESYTQLDAEANHAAKQFLPIGRSLVNCNHSRCTDWYCGGGPGCWPSPGCRLTLRGGYGPELLRGGQGGEGEDLARF